MIFRLSYVNRVHGKLNICQRGPSVWARLRYVQPTNIERTDVRKVTSYIQFTSTCSYRTTMQQILKSTRVAAILLIHHHSRYLRFPTACKPDFTDYLHARSLNTYFPVSIVSLYLHNRRKYCQVNFTCQL